MRKTQKLYTKEEIQQVIHLWDDSSMADIARRLDRNVASIAYIAKRIRLCGYDLPKKKIAGKVDSLIKEVISEIGQ